MLKFFSKTLFLTFCLFLASNETNAQISIGTLNPPDASAALDMRSITSKGVLLPQVALTSPTDVATIPNPALGLLIYNTGANANYPVRAYVYWDGQEWKALNSMTTSAATGSLQCGMAYLDPEIVIVGDNTTPIPTGTVIKVPYSVGNGGVYNGCVLVSDGNPDVTATLSSGQLENGSGYLTFHLTGVPNAAQKTPLGIKFSLAPFYTANPTFDPSTATRCSEIAVGIEVKADLRTIALIDNLKLTTEDNSRIYAAQLTTPDGKFSVRCCIVESNLVSFGTDAYTGMNLQIRNNQNHTVVISYNTNWEWVGNAANSTNALALVPGKWCGDNDIRNGNDANSPAWASWLDGNASAATSDPKANSASDKENNRAKYVWWGNAGVYAGGSPERRTYSWTINDGADTKAAYFMTFSTSAMRPGDPPNPTSCPNGVCAETKAFLMIDQVIAAEGY